MTKRAFLLFSEFKWRMIIVIGLGILGIIAYSMMPTYLNFALDHLKINVPNPEVSYIFTMLGIFLGLALVNEIFAVVCIFLILNYEASVIQQTNLAVKRRLDVVPIRFLESYTTGDLTRIVCYNVPDMMKNMLLVIYQIARASFFFITTSIAMLSINWILAIVVISSLPLCVVTAKFVSKRTQKYFRAQNDTNGNLSTYLDQKVSLHGFYRMHGLDGDVNEFNNKNEEHRKAVVGEVTATAFNTSYITFIRNFMYLLITVLCCVLILTYPGGNISIATLPVFLLFGQRFLDNTVVVSTATNVLQILGARAKYVFGVLDSPEDITEREHIEIDRIKGDIQFTHVSLIEDGVTQLDNISFVIPQGSSIAIVGPTGAGKHRMVELMSKLGNPTSGMITIDGVDLTEIKSASFYRRMGIATEKPFIFKGTVAENILYGIGRALPEKVMKITKQLGSHDFIEQLPKGYETMLNEKTGLLTTSQKQGINVARTVLQAPDLIILDCALSTTDNIIEKQVINEIIKQDKHQTKIFITHRLGSIQNCDLILFMENGHIVEQGTHDELIKMRGEYFKAFTNS